MQASVLTTDESVSPALSVRMTNLCGDLGPEDPVLLSEWHELFSQSQSACYLQDPNQVFLTARLSLDDRSLAPKLVTCHGGQQLVAVGALIPKRIAFGPRMHLFTGRSLKGYRLAGSSFLENQENSPEVVSELMEAIASELSAPEADFVLFEDLEHDSIEWNALHNLSRRGYLLHLPQGVQPRLRIRFPETPVDYWKQFSSKTRNTFKRKQKNLGETQLLKFTRSDEVPEFLRLSHQVSQQSWQTRQLGPRIENSASERSLLEWEASAGVFRSYVLMQSGRPLAFLQGNQYRGWFNYEEVGYDQEFASRSPGTVLLLQVFEELFENNPPEVFDFGVGDADYKRMFANWTSQSGAVWLVSRKFSAQAIVRGLQAALVVRKFGKSLMARAGLWRRVRQFLRRGSVGNEARGVDRNPS